MSGTDDTDGTDLKEWCRERMRQTPWWALSIGFHGLLLAALGLVQIAGVATVFTSPQVIGFHVPAKPRLENVERQRGPEDVPLPPTDEMTFEPSEDAALIKLAKLAKHNETDNDNPFDDDVSAPTESDETNISDTPGLTRGLGRDPNDLNPGKHDRIGTGGNSGGGGGFGRRGRGGDDRFTTGCTYGSESAVTAGLRWLARHQSSDGSWRAETFAHSCAPGTACDGPGYGQFDTGLTGLSLLAFLGAGYTHLSRVAFEDAHANRTVRFGDVVKGAQAALVRAQDDDGCLGPRTGEFMYNHAIATLALVEAYGMTNASRLKGPAEKAIAFLVAAQNPYRGWRYSVKPGDNDTSVTGWCVMALKSAAASNLAIPRTSMDGARAWIDSVTDEQGQVGYTGKGKVGVVIPGKNDAWRDHPAMTAVGLLCRIFIDGAASGALLEKHAALVSADLPRWETPSQEKPIDFYYWYYGALALFQHDAPSGRHWKGWNAAMQKALLPRQATRAAGCLDGSWDPAVDRWGAVGGRVYATAINVLTLEVFYRYGRVLGK